MKNIKVGSVVKIIDSKPQQGQDEFNIGKYIGENLTVLAHWKQTSNDLENGQIQVNLESEGGVIILNKGEYKIVG